MRWLLVCGVLLGQAGTALAGEWQVDRQAKGNRVGFESTVAAFSFRGETDRLDGYAYWKGPDQFAPGNQVHFEVELDGLDTGIGKRDRDLREVLATARWPKAVFAGEVVRHEPVDSTVTAYRVTARGKMSLHGVDRELEVTGILVVEPGQWRVTAAFPLRLSDYAIQAPNLVAFVKVNDEIAIDVSLVMKRAQ
jgi:polyisoprenoid-binding protein YceI